MMQPVSPQPERGDPAASAARDRVEQSWAENAEAWTRAVREGRIPSRRLGTDAAILELVLSAEPATALDVGCGEGWLTRALGARGIEVVGIDSSRPLIARARALGGGRFEALSYDELTADPESVSGPFDAVVCNFSLFIDNLEPLLRALASRLSATGALFIQTAHPDSEAADGGATEGWRMETFDSFDVKFPAEMPWYLRTVESWYKVVAAAGMHVIERRDPVNPETGKPLSLLLACGKEN